MRATSHEDLRLVWARTATTVASSPHDVQALLDLVDGEQPIDGFEPDQQMRWSLAIKAIAHDLEGANERLAVEGSRDRSDRGQRSLVRAAAARPDQASKAEIWERINGEGFGSDYLTRSAIAGFQWLHQRDMLLPFREPFFERVEQVYATHDYAFADSYVRWLVPDRWAEPDVLDQITSARAELGDEAALLRRQLDEIGDDLARAIRVRNFARNGAAG